MARIARRYCCPDAPFQHVWNRVAGAPDYYPLRRRRAQHQFFVLLRRYLSAYSLRLVAVTLMGNHFHLVLHCPAFRPLPRQQLRRRAAALWGPQAAALKTAAWDQDRWQHFNRKLFSLSDFMQHLQGEYAKWFNRTYGRRGHFWADRFASNGLFDPQALQDTLLYVELNPVRAHLVTRPEHWKASSAAWRAGPGDPLLVPLQDLFTPPPGKDVFEEYRGRLFHRGAIPPRPGDGVIPAWVLDQERRRGFRRPGLFRYSLPLFRHGVGLGSRSTIEQRVLKLVDDGFYSQRRHAISHLKGLFFTVREQRSHAIPT